MFLTHAITKALVPYMKKYMLRSGEKNEPTHTRIDTLIIETGKYGVRGLSIEYTINWYYFHVGNVIFIEQSEVEKDPALCNLLAIIPEGLFDRVSDIKKELDINIKIDL